MKRLSILFVALLALACSKSPAKLGTNLPSGNGQALSSKSVSVVPASDAVFTVSGSTLTVTAADGGFATESTLSTLNGKVPSKGTAVMTGSTPVTIATDDTMTKKLTQPGTFITVTKSDSTDTSSYCTKGFWVGTACDVAVLGVNDPADAAAASTLKNVPSGAFVPGSFQRIMSTNTGTCNIVCFGP